MTQSEPSLINDLVAGITPKIVIYPDGRCIADAPIKGAMLSGSFNPLHDGHVDLVDAAAKQTGAPICFELPVINADKGALDEAEIERRLLQFRDKYTVVLSRAPLFCQKAALFPGVIFIVGYDTAERFVQPRYYGDTTDMYAAMTSIRAAGCSFLVAGRLKNNLFHTLADIVIPPDFQDMFTCLPETLFRRDISSTELRAQARQTHS